MSNNQDPVSTTLPRARSRGSAAVELLLSVPFLVMFCLAMMDFGRGFLSAQRGQRAARHAAWVEARAEGGAPSSESLYGLHFRSRGGVVSRTATTQDVGLFSYFSDLGSGVEDVLEFVGGDRIGGAFAFMTGNADVTTASVTQTVSGIRVMATGSEMTQTHHVSLRSHPEEEPDNPEGWFDPFYRLANLIDEIGG